MGEKALQILCQSTYRRVALAWIFLQGLGQNGVHIAAQAAPQFFARGVALRRGETIRGQSDSFGGRWRIPLDHRLDEFRGCRMPPVNRM